MSEPSVFSFAMRLPPEEAECWVTALPQPDGFAVITSAHHRQWAIVQLSETAFRDRRHFAEVVQAAADHLDGLLPFTAAEKTSERAPAIRELFLHLTDRCNLTCRHCYYRNSHRSPLDLSPAAIEKLIGILTDSGLEKVTLSGGEPSLHPAFPKLLKLIRQAGLAAMVLTNGTLVDDAFIAALQSADRVLVSLHGPDAASHERLTGPGTYQPVIASLKRLREVLPADHLVVNCTMTDWNIDRLEEMTDLAASLGPARIRFMPLHTVNAATEGGPRLDYRSTELLRWVRAAAEGIVGGRWPLRVAVGLTGLPGYLNPQAAAENDAVCGVGRQLTVGADGALYPCPCLMTEPFRLGEANAVDRSDKLPASMARWEKIVRERRSVIAACRDCPLGGICQGGCPALAFQTAGSFRQTDPLCRAVREYSLAYFTAVARRSLAARDGQGS